MTRKSTRGLTAARDGLRQQWLRLRYRLRYRLVPPRAFVSAAIIRSWRGARHLVLSRVTWLALGLVIGLLVLAWPEASRIFTEEGGFGLVGECVGRIRSLLEMILAWGIPDTPLAVPGYAFAYLALVIVGRAWRRARHHTWRVQPFRVTEGQTGVGALLASQFRNVLEELRRLRWEHGPVLISETGIMRSLADRPLLVPVQLVGGPLPSDGPEIEIAGLSPKTIEDLARYLMGSETVITGDLYSGKAKWELSVRVPGVGEWRASVGTPSERASVELKDLALRVLRDVEPVTYVGYLIAAGSADVALNDLLNSGVQIMKSRKDWLYSVEFAASIASWQLRGTMGAIDAERRGLAAVPGSAMILNASATRLLIEGDVGAAVEAAQAAIQKAPWSPAPRLTLANALTAQGDPSRALGPALMAYWLRQQGRDALHVTLGRIYLGLGEKRKAERHLKAAIRLTPTDGLPRVYLSHTRTSPREQLSILEEAVSLAPNDPSVHFTMGQLRADLGQFEEASLSFRRLIELAPNSADNHFWLYLALTKQGRADEANKELEIARQMGSDYAKNWVGRLDFSKKTLD